MLWSPVCLTFWGNAHYIESEGRDYDLAGFDGVLDGNGSIFLCLVIKK